MNSAPHRIRSLRWQVGAGSTTEAFAWRALLREQGMDLLMPVLEQGFDEAALGEHVIHIPRIELNVRLDSKEKFETILPGEILHQLREQLQRLLAGDGTAGQDPVGEGISAGRNHFDILLRYLQTGRLSWQVTSASASDQAISLSGTCRDECPRIREHLTVIQEEATFYFRLLQLFSEQEWGLLIQEISPVIPRETRMAVMQCLELLLDNHRERFSHYTRLNLIAGILAESTGWREHCGPRSLLKVAAAAVPPQEQHQLEIFVANLPRPVAPLFQQEGVETASGSFGSAPEVGVALQSGSPHPEGHPEDTIAARQRHPYVVPEETDYQPAPVDLGHQPRSEPSDELFLLPKLDQQAERLQLQPSLKLPDSLHPSRHPEDTIAARQRHPGVVSEEAENPPSPPDMGHQSRSGPSAELYPMLVQQAGLVLLHPYIVRLFDNCGVKDAGIAELHVSALPRAAALLYLLATGREELYEYELGLIKILLGLHPETALPVCAGLLTPDDVDEADTLLQSVIDHWSVLKNTSIQGVRSSFIERQGLMREDDSGWSLNVERKPYDMLLDQIPWSISIVKLPWMQRAIFTEW